MELKHSKNTLYVTILMMVLGGGGYSIYHSSSLNENLEGNFYDFDFYLETTDFNESSNNKLVLQDFIIYYDFTSKEGSVTFDLGKKNWSIKQIQIYFPREVNNDTIGVYIESETGTSRKEITNWKTLPYPSQDVLDRSKINRTLLEIEDFEVNYSDVNFIINFTLDINPKGRFSFTASDKLSLHAREKGNVNFILGNDYECRGVCVYDLWNMVETNRSFDRDLRLEFETEKNIQYTFKLNAASRKITQRKDLSLGLGIALLVASITSLISILLTSHQNERKERLRNFLSGESKIKGVGEKTMKKIKKYFE